MWIRRVLLCAALAASALPAIAFDRPFAPTARRGTMSPAPYPEIIIDGKMRRLSAGARIWNEDNLLEQPASLRGDGRVVNYTETAEGDIDRIWILDAEEAAQSLPAQKSPQPQ